MRLKLWSSLHSRTVVPRLRLSASEIEGRCSKVTWSIVPSNAIVRSLPFAKFARSKNSGREARGGCSCKNKEVHARKYHATTSKNCYSSTQTRRLKVTLLSLSPQHLQSVGSAGNCNRSVSFNSCPDHKNSIRSLFKDRMRAFTESIAAGRERRRNY